MNAKKKLPQKGTDRFPSPRLHVASSRTVGRDRLRTLLFLGGGILTLCFLTACETTLCAALPLPFGLSPGRPWLALLFVLSSGFLLGGEVGGFFGLIAGVLTDAVCMDRLAGGLFLHPLVWLLMGFGTGWLAQRILAHNMPSYLLFVLAAALAEAVLLALLGGMPPGHVIPGVHLPPWSYVMHTLVPDVLWTVLLSPLLYMITKWLFVRRRKPPLM